MHAPHPAQRAGRRQRAGRLLSRDRAPLPVLQRWWFWVGVIGLLWLFPLWKSLSARLPARLPGEDGPALDFALTDELERPFRLADLRGRCVIVTALPLAEGNARDTTWERLVALRKHLRGLDQALVYAILAQGGSAADLKGWLDEHRAPRPELHFGMDAGGAAMKRLCAAAGAPSAEFLLIDRHGRIRGAYGGEQLEVDRLITEAGQLANWAGEDGER